MQFNSPDFLIFFTFVVVLYFGLPYRRRWILLLAANYYFYMCWKAEYALLLLASTTIDYFLGLCMGATPSKRERKKFLYISILSNLGILFFFKYVNFFNESVVSVANKFNIFYQMPEFNMLLPVGISFYTFQSISYAIEVYRGTIKPERHFGILAVYVSFFPQLVAGPIERPGHLLPQFYQQHDFDYSRVASGVRLMLWGFFKKIVIADRLASVVNCVYDDPAAYHSGAYILATVFFGYQIYCDFSGYTDIARGAARIMGIDLIENFRAPYWSRSVREFWQRWHMSLMAWLKNYVYIPCGGNRVNAARWCASIMIVFLLSGLWHGASWTYVMWGGLNGVYVIVSSMTKGLKMRVVDAIGLFRWPRLHAFIQIATTFALINFAWIFFRSKTTEDIFFIITRLWNETLWMLTHPAQFATVIKDPQLFNLGFPRSEYLIDFFLILFLECIQRLELKKEFFGRMHLRPGWMRWSFYFFCCFAIAFWGRFDNSQFIYFQF